MAHDSRGDVLKGYTEPGLASLFAKGGVAKPVSFFPEIA
jgi:hypothetical protein